MKRIKRDLPIYVLSASLVFFGISIQITSAGAATSSNSQVTKIQNDLSQLKDCVNYNTNSLRNFDAKYNSRINVVYC
jgi:hypothetical protein